MRVLLIAPQPVFVPRGTPIAVRAVVETLSANGHTVDLLSFHGGQELQLAGVRHVRIGAPPFVRTVPVGISWQKLVCNVGLLARALRLIRRERYDCIHAVEDGIFLALLLRPFVRASLVYDMDSIMSDQIVDKRPRLAGLRGTMRAVERMAMRRSDLVLCVCPALAERVREDAPSTRCVLLHDYPLPDEGAQAPPLREAADTGRVLALYVGNFQPYQGVETLLEAARQLPDGTALDVAMVGDQAGTGGPARRGDEVLANGVRLRWFGPSPLSCLAALLLQADILLSPRTRGVNTPMKIYSYMMAGRGILATDIVSHTQVLDASCAMLVPPTAPDLARGLAALAADPALRARLGAAAHERVVSRYSKARFEQILLGAYARLTPPKRGGSSAPRLAATNCSNRRS